MRAHIDNDQQASARFSLGRTTTVRVHIVRSQEASLRGRLNAPD